MDFSVKDALPPAVPLKTYQWEDLKRDKERGKYPYTYLTKNLLVEQDKMTMEEKKPLVSTDTEQKKLEDGEQRRKEDIYAATNEETERSENKEEQIIYAKNERLIMQQDSTENIEIKYELLVEDDSFYKTDSKNTESENTYRAWKIEQYLDKEQISKSILDTSRLEAGASASNAGFVHDSNLDVIASVSEILEIPQEHKCKHSGSSVGTKTNLSLFETIKKFKPLTFAIPQFKKFALHKKGSKRLKHDFKEQKYTVIEDVKPEVTLQTQPNESPVYIYIPLNPTAEDLEKERQEAMKSELHRRLASDFRTDRRKNSKATNGTMSSATTSRNIDVQSASFKWKGLQSKTDKTSPPVKKKSKDANTKRESLKSVSTKPDDSPVEYIYIPLKPPENETWNKPSPKKAFDKIEAVNTKLISTQVTKVDKPVVKEEDIITETKEPQKSETEIKQLSNIISKPDEHQSKGASKKKSGKTTKLTKDIKKSVSKLKGEQTKAKRSSSSLKVASKQTSVENKTSPTSKKHDDSPVEYIYIPLKGPLPDENPKQVEVKRKENISTEVKIQEVTVAIVEKEKPSLMSKFNGPKIELKSPPAIKKNIKQFTGKKGSPKSSMKETVEKKSSPLLPSVKRSDSPVEYIYIPLKPLDTEVSNDKAEGTIMELQTSKEDFKLENRKVASIKQVESKVTKLEKIPDKPKETQKGNIMTKLKDLKPNKAQALKTDVKSKKEQVTEKIKSLPKDLQSSDAPVEYIYIPLKPPTSEKAESNIEVTINNEESMKVETVSDIVAQSSSLPLEEPKRRKMEDNTEEARLIMEAVIKTWQGFKTKPLQKPMPLKRTDPKTTSPITEKISGSVVFGSGESPVEYIYIPLNPTEEQLEYERVMKEQKRLPAPRASSAARTPERSVIAEDKSKRAAVKTGAIKKQPTEKGNKVKDTTTKLTEDIKKFATKLKDMQKKSKKPTYKTFKHGSKSSRMSPTTSKKPVDSRSPPISRQCEDTPVEYIFIPLKDPETTEEIEIEAAISIPSEIVEKVEKAVKKSSTLEASHYKLLTKEDEEDGLKTAIIASLNKMKPSDEVLETQTSLELNRKLSIESIKMEKMKNDFDKSQNGDENTVYEQTIQMKDEEPNSNVSTARKLITVDEQIIKDTSLEDEHNKWSKSTLLAVC